MVEISGVEDLKGLKELDINPKEELLYLTNDTEYKLLNQEDIPNHKVLTKEQFKEYLYNTNDKQLFNVYTKDGYVTRVEQQYLP